MSIELTLNHRLRRFGQLSVIRVLDRSIECALIMLSLLSMVGKR